MKRLGQVYEAVCEYGNLLDAFAAVRRGHRRSRAVAAFAADLHVNLARVREDLLSGDFRFGNYFLFKVFDPKERLIAAAPVRERVIHHAVMNVCGARLERCLIDHTYACRRGKGQWKAVEAARRYARLHAWCLKLDIRRYFDSIDHAVLSGLLGRLFKDRRLLGLFRALVASYETAPGKGLPIGNLTSQHFANLYLAPADRLVSACGAVGYVRYMDDMLVFGAREELKRVLRALSGFLEEALKLEIKHGGSLHRTARGVDFLGCRILPGVLRLSARSRRRFFRKSARCDRLFDKGNCSERAYQQRLTALYAFARHADTLGLRRQALGGNGQREQPPASRRELEQQRAELPVGEPEQQQPVQRQQQQRPARACPPCSSAEYETATNRPFSRSRVGAGQKARRPAGAGRRAAEGHGAGFFFDKSGTPRDAGHGCCFMISTKARRRRHGNG